jgi:nicotinamidase-related amidase
MTQALVLIDIQNDYFPGGNMELAGGLEAGIQAGILLRTFRQTGRPILHIQHIAARPGATFFLPGTAGAGIHASVTPLPDETVFQKHFPNSFRETPLLGHLRGLGVTELIVAGMMTHMCIDTTVRAAFDLGFQCQLAQEACATRNLSMQGVTVPADQVQTAFLAAIDGTFARVLSVREICAGL